jgi:hypothetical protein
VETGKAIRLYSIYTCDTKAKEVLISAVRARPERLSGWASRDSKEVFRPAWSERCGPQPLAGSIVARDFDTKRI